MVICKYFLTDSCRYGSRCRFEHARSAAPNPYVYDVRQKSGVSVLQRDSGAGAGAGAAQAVSAQRYTVRNTTQVQVQKRDDLSEYLEMMVKEVNRLESERMWPLTCLGILRGHVNIPGWVDYSPEELRWEAYKCEKEGRFQTYVAGVKTLIDKAKELRSIFMRPTKMAESIIRDYLKQSSVGETTAIGTVNRPLFGSVFQNNDALNTFSFALEQSSGGFNTQPTPFSLGFLSPAPSGFGGPQRPLQDSGSFGEIPKERPAFGRTPVAEDQGDARLYTRIELLTAEEMDQFRANTFTIGKIPVRPPPKELCHS